jgi:hypothetical protein
VLTQAFNGWFISTFLFEIACLIFAHGSDID